MVNNWVFQPLQMPVSVLVFVSVVLAVTAWVSYSNWNRRRGAGVAALELLRFVIMGMILFTLCKPEYLRTTTIEQQPEVAILTDISESMTVMDAWVTEDNVVTRAEWLSDQKGLQASLSRIGTQDKFMTEAGEQDYAREFFGISKEQIAERVLKKL